MEILRSDESARKKGGSVILRPGSRTANRRILEDYFKNSDSVPDFGE